MKRWLGWIAVAGASCLALACGDPGNEDGTGLQRVASAIVADAPTCGACSDTDYCMFGQCTAWLGFYGGCTEVGKSCYYDDKGLCVGADEGPSGPLCLPRCVVSLGYQDCGPAKNGITQACFYFSDVCQPNPTMLCVAPAPVPKKEGQVCRGQDCGPHLQCVSLISRWTTECRYFCLSDDDCAWKKPGSTCLPAICPKGTPGTQGFGFCGP
jgi:hypothetical protein